MSIKDKVAIVTGAGKGLGKGIAQKLYQEGALLSLWDIDYQLVKDVAGELDADGNRVLPLKVDITDEAMVKDAIEKTLDRYSTIDILVNNAGISNHKPVDEMPLEVFEKVVKVNLTGTFICCKAVTPVMKKQERGKIVNIASLGGRTGRPGVGVNYAAAKAGVIGLTQTIARELGKFGIYANAICPGPILTEQTRQYPKEVFASWNVGRAVEKDGLPEDVAEAVIFLASEKSDWITGVTLDVNGGIYIK
jgi:3-oxoacyl-[acyl-carrier protein] reductase